MEKRDRVTEKLTDQAYTSSHKECAIKVREALESEGFKIGKHGSAYNYGKPLENVGFKPAYIHNEDKLGKELPKSYQPKKGDIIVIQPTSDGKHKDGHIAMNNGQ